MTELDKYARWLIEHRVSCGAAEFDSLMLDLQRLEDIHRQTVDEPASKAIRNMMPRQFYVAPASDDPAATVCVSFRGMGIVDRWLDCPPYGQA